MELVAVAELEKALAALMERKGVKSWIETAFDAQDIEWLIKETPTVDAEPVRHGQWLDCESYNDIRQCSECGLIRNIYKQEGWNFCPHCGAKMQEEEDARD